MKIGYCVNMLSGKPDGTGLENIELIKKAGYDYIEMPMAQVYDLTPQEQREYAKTIRENGLSCEVCNNFLPARIRLTGENITEDTELFSYLNKAFEIADIFGISVFVVGSPKSRNIPADFPYDIAIEQMIDFYTKLSDIMPDGKVAVIEPICAKETNIILSVSEGLSIVKLVNRDNIKVLADYYHMQNENENESIIMDAGNKFLKHVHISPLGTRKLPLNADENMKSFLISLLRIKYNDRISVEAYSDISEDVLTSAVLDIKETLASFDA